MAWMDSGSPSAFNFSVNNASGTRYSAITKTTPFVANTWYHVVCICPGTRSSLKIYINGTDATNTTATLSGNLLQPDSPLMLGSNGYADDRTT